MAYLRNELVAVSSTSTSITYKIRVIVERTTSFFAKNPSTNYICVKNHNGTPLNYIGWPKASAWPLRDASSGTLYYPNSVYTNGSTINPGPGSAQCVLLNNFVYESSNITVPVSKGNNRKGSITITAGAESKIQTGNFAISRISKTFYTSETAEPEFSSDPIITLGETSVRIQLGFSNPDSYYVARLYDENGALLQESTSAIDKTITFNDDMYGKAFTYRVALVGKDGNTYRTKYPKFSVPKKGFAIYVQDTTIHETTDLYFRNVSNKQPKEVWVKINGEIKQCEK